MLIEAARVKVEGDEVLKAADDEVLRERRLSSCNAVTIAVGMRYDLPMLSSDRDLCYVAGKLRVSVLW